MIPASFRSMRALRVLNVAGVGLSMATATSVALSHVFGSGDPDAIGLVSGPPTLFFGALWAHLLRQRQTWDGGNIRRGWVLSVPLAMLNAGTAGAILVGREGAHGMIGGFFLGSTLGVIVWGPALVAVLLVFGLPIARAQRQADRGLAGEERGEVIVGSTVAALSLLSLAPTLSGLLSGLDHHLSYRQYRLRHFVDWYPGSFDSTGHLLVLGAGALALACGVTAVALAVGRERRRRRFVAQVEEGKVPGFRVDPTPEGKVLLRVNPEHEGYRVADIDDEVLCELDAQGLARRPVERA